VESGRYRIGFMHPSLDALDLEGPVVPVEVSGDRRTTIALATPSPATAFARLCPGVRDTASGVIIGTVRNVDDKASLAGATVSTDWAEYTIGAGRPSAHRVHVEVRTNSNGLFLLCGVPLRVQLAVSAVRTGFGAGPIPLDLENGLFGRADLALSLRDSAAREPEEDADSSAIARSADGTASLRGVVLGREGKALRDAMIAIAGTKRSTRTDSSGAFRLDRIPAGTRTVEIRSIGLAPATAIVDFPTSAERDTTLRLGQTAQELLAITVAEGQRSMSLMTADGFDARQARGLGTYVTAKELSRNYYPDLIAVLEGLKGLRVDYTNQFPYVPQVSMLGISDYSNAYCTPNFFLDGAPFTGTFDQLQSLVRPEWIRGIEVYDTSGTMPAQYDYSSSTGCGSIIIWTR